jgi:hypothetical protein
MPNENNKPKTEGMVRAEERARLAAILESPVAASRPAVARKLALYTALPAAAILEMLADLPEEKETARDASAFLAAMEREGSTGVSSALGTAPANSPKEQRLAELQGAARAHNISHGYVSPRAAAAQGVTIKGI